MGKMTLEFKAAISFFGLLLLSNLNRNRNIVVYNSRTMGLKMQSGPCAQRFSDDSEIDPADVIGLLIAIVIFLLFILVVYKLLGLMILSIIAWFIFIIINIKDTSSDNDTSSNNDTSSDSDNDSIL